MKCATCDLKIETTFLKKILGTYVKVKGKQHAVCSICQKEKGEEQILKELS